MYQLNIPETVLAGIAFGVAFAFSMRHQFRLQQIALSDESKAPFLERLTYLGLSFSIMLAAVLAGKISAFATYDFLAIVIAAVGATWVGFYIQRSNRQLDRDA